MDGSWLYTTLLALQVIVVSVVSVRGEAIQLNLNSYEEYKDSKDIILLNFYADWCRFSQMLKPIFDKSADLLHTETDRILLGKVNCETDKNLCTGPFHISKYPTLKIVRHGVIARREYRGQRTVEAITDFLRDQIRDPVKSFTDIDDLTSQEIKKAMIGYFSDNMTATYRNFVAVAINLRDDCSFYSHFGDSSKLTQVIYREEKVADVIYPESLDDMSRLHSWASKQCLPLVREITFQNGEEMTELGLPLLILFYHPDDTSTKELFKQKVELELREHKGTVNCVTADGVMFAHPLHHLGKQKKHLPVLAIDSFRHMFLFPNFEDIQIEGKLHQFITDLHSGKLHKDFHDPPPPTHQQQVVHKVDVPQSPPESTFKKLAPARDRYSFRRDEL